MYDLLLENLFQNDLEHMIQPVISVDDFESKIDDDTMVFSFYVLNESAAEDLAIFIERSAVDGILDTEVSLTTNKDGDYLVFVEINKGRNILKTVFEMMDVVSRLSGPMKWRFKNNRLLKNKTYPLTEENLKVLLQKL